MCEYSHSIPLLHVSILMAGTHCSDYFSFVESFEILYSPTLFFFKMIFALQGTFQFHMNFRISSTISEKMTNFHRPFIQFLSQCTEFTILTVLCSSVSETRTAFPFFLYLLNLISRIFLVFSV